MGRDAMCIPRAQARSRATERRRRHHFLPRTPCSLQGAENPGLRHLAQDLDRKDPEVFAARPSNFAVMGGARLCDVLAIARCSNNETAFLRPGRVQIQTTL